MSTTFASDIETTPFSLFSPAQTDQFRVGSLGYVGDLKPTPTCDLDIVAAPMIPKGKISVPPYWFANVDSRRQRLQTHIVALLVSFHRVAASGDISDGVLLRPGTDFKSTHPDADRFAAVTKAICATNQGDAAEPPDYPTADFYEPADYAWTRDGFAVRTALKRYSESTHGDR